MIHSTAAFMTLKPTMAGWNASRHTMELCIAAAVERGRHPIQ